MAKHTAENAASNSTPPPETPKPESPKVDASPPEILGKLNAKDIVKRTALTYRKDADGKVIDPAPRSLYRVFGIVSGVEHGESTYGQWTAFTGTIEAIRFSDHQRFIAPKAFLQGASEGLLLDALKAAQKDDSTASLTFAFDIGVKPSEKWVTEDKGNSYEYTVKAVFKTQQHDPLKELREMTLQTLPALPPPA